MDVSDIDFNTVYHLNNSWTLFVHYYCHNNNYGCSYDKICSFSTIQDFWRVHNNFPSAKQLATSYILHDDKYINAFSLFKDNIRPEWEHNKNIKGSEWGCRNVYSEECFKCAYENLVFAAIGNKIRHCTGVRAVNKSTRYKTYMKIEVWLSTCDQTCVNQSFSDIMSCIEDHKLIFTHTHHEEKKKTMSHHSPTKLTKKKNMRKS